MPAGVLLSRGSWVSMVLKVASVLHPSLRHHSMPGGLRLMVFSGTCEELRLSWRGSNPSIKSTYVFATTVERGEKQGHKDRTAGSLDT